VANCSIAAGRLGAHIVLRNSIATKEETGRASVALTGGDLAWREL